MGEDNYSALLADNIRLGRLLSRLANETARIASELLASDDPRSETLAADLQLVVAEVRETLLLSQEAS